MHFLHTRLLFGANSILFGCSNSGGIMWMAIGSNKALLLLVPIGLWWWCWYCGWSPSLLSGRLPKIYIKKYSMKVLQKQISLQHLLYLTNSVMVPRWIPSWSSIQSRCVSQDCCPGIVRTPRRMPAQSSEGARRRRRKKDPRCSSWAIGGANPFCRLLHSTDRGWCNRLLPMALKRI